MHTELVGSAVVLFILLMIGNLQWKWRALIISLSFVFTFNESSHSKDYSSFFGGMFIAQLVVHPTITKLSLQERVPNLQLPRRTGTIMQAIFINLGLYCLSMPCQASDKGEDYYWFVFPLIRPFGLTPYITTNRIGSIIFMAVLCFSRTLVAFTAQIASYSLENLIHDISAAL